MHSLINTKDYQLVQIQSIQMVGQLDTIDIQIQDTQHIFVLENGICTHNSALNSDLVLGDGISHSMGKLEIADFMVSMSRKHQDKLSNTARFVVVKNRSGRDGMVYNGITNFQNGDIQMFDTYTKDSVQAKHRMDNNDILLKQRVRERLLAIKDKKEQVAE